MLGLTLYVEFNGPVSLESETVAAERRKLLAVRYAGQPIEVLVAIGDRMLPQAEALRQEFFPHARLFFVTILRSSIPNGLQQGEGLLVDVNPLPAIQLALTLMPQISRVTVIGGNSTVDQLLQKSLAASLAPYTNRLQIDFLRGLTLPELQAKQFDRNTLIVLTSYVADRSGRATTNAEQARELSVKGPVVEGSDLSLGYGSLGGDVICYRQTGREIGHRIRRTLDTGYAPAGVVVEPAPRRKALDWRQLKRLEIPESRVRGDFEILYREPTVWEEHKAVILGVAGGLALQTVLISFLLSERRRRSQAQEQIRAMLASLPGFVMMIDENGRILKHNDRLDLSESSLPRSLAGARTGENLMELWRADGEASDQIVKALEAVIQRDQTSVVLEHPFETEDQVRWTEIRAESLFGKQRGAVVSLTDITERKRAENESAQIRQTSWHLNRVAALGELSASIAHEINQPLTAILNSAEAADVLLKRDNPAVDDALEAIRDIINDNKRAGAIIHKVRSMLKRSYDGVHAMDLNAAVSETIRLVANEARMRHVTLQHLTGQDLPLVLAEPIRLQQVILNLTTNAIEAVESMPEVRRVELRTLIGQNEMAVLEVWDSGPGIPPEKINVIFEPFYTTKREGLGFGLSICRSIVNSFDGKLTAENAVNGGALFRVSLRPAAGEQVRGASYAAV